MDHSIKRLITLHVTATFKNLRHMSNSISICCVTGMNIFVAFFLLLRILADSTPPASSTIPLIGKPV
jgi:hypothetical protein